MQKQATLLDLFAILFTLFISAPTVQAADDKEAYGTGKLKKKTKVLVRIS